MLKFGRAILGLGKEIFFDSFSVLIQFSIVFDEKFAFQYFHKCSDHKGKTKIISIMFGLICMNVVKVEKTHPCLKVGSLRSRRPHTVYSRMKRPVAPLCCTEGP